MNIDIPGTDNMSTVSPKAILVGMRQSVGFAVDRLSEKESLARANRGHKNPLASGFGWRLYDFWGDYEDFNLVIDEDKFHPVLMKAIRAFVKNCDKAIQRDEDLVLPEELEKPFERLLGFVVNERGFKDHEVYIKN